jgi:hypothetical protein
VCEELSNSAGILVCVEPIAVSLPRLSSCSDVPRIHDKTVGFPGKHQDRLSVSRDYDQQEEIDDDALNFRKGNFDPIDPDPDSLYF